MKKAGSRSQDRALELASALDQAAGQLYPKMAPALYIVIICLICKSGRARQIARGKLL